MSAPVELNVRFYSRWTPDFTLKQLTKFRSRTIKVSKIKIKTQTCFLLNLFNEFEANGGRQLQQRCFLKYILKSEPRAEKSSFTHSSIRLTCCSFIRLNPEFWQWSGSGRVHLLTMCSPRGSCSDRAAFNDSWFVSEQNFQLIHNERRQTLKRLCAVSPDPDPTREIRTFIK